MKMNVSSNSLKKKCCSELHHGSLLQFRVTVTSTDVAVRDIVVLLIDVPFASCVAFCMFHSSVKSCCLPSVNGDANTHHRESRGRLSRIIYANHLIQFPSKTNAKTANHCWWKERIVPATLENNLVKLNTRTLYKPEILLLGIAPNFPHVHDEICLV